MSDTNLSDAWVQKIAASVLGAAVSLRFIQGALIERGLMFIGAVACSFYGTDLVAAYLKMQDAKGLVGLLLGLYTMPVVAKVYEAIALVDTKKLSEVVLARLKRVLGG